MKINIISAISKNGIIGGDNKLLWHYKEDLHYFKERTLGYPLIMGFNTFQSLPSTLKGRHHLVLNLTTEGTINKDITFVTSISQAIEKANELSDEVFVIGGGVVYKQFIFRADRMYLTRINKEFEGDTYFPKVPEGLFKLVSSKKGENEDLTFEIWERDVNYIGLIHNNKF